MTSPGPIAFTIFGIDIRWYGILIATGIVAAILVSSYRFKKHNLNSEDVMDLAIICIPAGIIGARLYYVAFEWENYSGNLLNIFNTRLGGLAVHGGLILGIASAVFVCKHKKIPFPDGLDATVCGIVLAQSIGRWGNFFNSEAHGGPTDLPWGIQVKGTYVHPTFLYESLWCLILFFVLSHIDSNRKFIGQTSLLYGILYSAERFFVEGLRTDSLMIGPFRQAQVLSAGVIIVCLILYIILYKKSRQFSK